ncbi:MAG: hypothetical protein ACXIU7_04710 [Roseinatronobacter sp.]
MNLSRAAIVLLVTLAFVVSPLVANPFTGFDPGRFPVPQLNPPVQPAGYAFGIWSVIYLWLLASAIFGLAMRKVNRHWERMRLPLMLSLGPGALWLSIAGFSPIAATILIFWMLGTALWAVLMVPRGDRWLAEAPVGLYAGWLTAAAHVSLGISLAGYGLLEAKTAAFVCLSMAVIVALVVITLRPRNYAYVFAVLWALLAVAIANYGRSFPVLGVAVIAMLVVVGALMVIFRARQQPVDL